MCSECGKYGLVKSAGSRGLWRGGGCGKVRPCAYTPPRARVHTHTHIHTPPAASPRVLLTHMALWPETRCSAVAELVSAVEATLPQSLLLCAAVHVVGSQGSSAESRPAAALPQAGSSAAHLATPSLFRRAPWFPG